MTIIRSPRPESHWTTFSNDLLRDERLSFAALGILASVLSRPDNWSTGVDRLTTERREGREVVTRAMKELVAAGYVRREKRRAQDGRMSTYNVFYDVPQTAEPVKPQVAPEYGLPQPGEPGYGLPSVGNPYDLRRTDLRKNFPPPGSTTSHPVAEPQQEEDPQREERHEQARSLLRSVCEHVPETRRPDAQQRRTLVQMTSAALAAGWTANALRARLTDGDLNACQSVYAVLKHRLTALPPAPARAPSRSASVPVFVPSEPLPEGATLAREEAKRLIREKTQGSKLLGALKRADPVAPLGAALADGFQRLMQSGEPSPA